MKYVLVKEADLDATEKRVIEMTQTLDIMANRMAELQNSLRPLRRPVTDDEIFDAVCARLAVSAGQVRRRCNRQESHRLRATVAEILHLEHGWGPSRIGRMMRRDHGSVINMLRPRTAEMEKTAS
jgi:hypothetical protein